MDLASTDLIVLLQGHAQLLETEKLLKCLKWLMTHAKLRNARLYNSLVLS